MTPITTNTGGRREQRAGDTQLAVAAFAFVETAAFVGLLAPGETPVVVAA
jgi:hypothetical protein